ncbi:hypothetical protein EWM64_g3592 [Hericium alpestre]|uniref:Ino eighty subunit 1 n=1 Tax=Hericium alpestre TaxID=135208 RepID=A0A4Z0A1T3_9AGAM|nr:hypothetical protein EWM64_g3592 [Hericium alpestre]
MLAFTDETPGKPPIKVNFCDLYVNALFNSAKCSKIMRDKMNDTPAFAIEFGKISLLTNVGRINTTMAFFPEMKTALRSYHPVPSLQKTDGNVQDAPRIKNCLKAALLPGEQRSAPPSTPADIITRASNGHVPPTSIVNLLFVLTNYSTSLGPVHFEHPVEFIDLFLPTNMSSPARAKAFLWMVFHYHEGPALPNPFADDHARAHPVIIEAWNRVQTLDPLMDSDEEGLDEYARAEYQGRLRVLGAIWPQARPSDAPR